MDKLVTFHFDPETKEFGSSKNNWNMEEIEIINKLQSSGFDFVGQIEESAKKKTKRKSKNKPYYFKELRKLPNGEALVEQFNNIMIEEGKEKAINGWHAATKFANEKLAEAKE